VSRKSAADDRGPAQEVPADPAAADVADLEEVEDVEDVLWCEECHRIVDPEAVSEDGLCPRCGNELLMADPTKVARRRVPWTFKLMIVATVVYLGYRAYQGIAWLSHHF
jgi:uncharacterized paraquat-inducible protein A